MALESRPSFEQMLSYFAYDTAETAVLVAGEGSAVGRTGKKQKTAKAETMTKREKKSPAPPQTPPRPPRRGGMISSLPHTDGVAVGAGAKVAESAALMSRETMADDAVAGTSAAVEDGRPQRQLLCLIHPGGPSSFLLGLLSPSPPGKSRFKNREYFSSYDRMKSDGKPVISSSFFRVHASATTGEEEGEEEKQIELVEEEEKAGKESEDESRVLDNLPRDGENKGNQINATCKKRNNRNRKKKRACGGASRSVEKCKVERDEDRKLKKKKKVLVVSPYFTASSAQRAPGGGAGARDEAEVVVQRRSRRKRTSQATESAADSQTSSGPSDGKLKPVDRKKKRTNQHQSVLLTAAERMADAYKRVPADSPRFLPFSDRELLQELHLFDHWRVLVICMLLNRTTGREVGKILPRLFLLCPDAEATTKVSEEEIEEIIRPLGLQKKRSKMIKRMSEEYLGQEWTHVTQLHGIGKYAADAYAIFCSGMWMEVKPDDHKLVDYWRFLLNDKDAREIILVQKST